MRISGRTTTCVDRFHVVVVAVGSALVDATSQAAPGIDDRASPRTTTTPIDPPPRSLLLPALPFQCDTAHFLLSVRQDDCCCCRLRESGPSRATTKKKHEPPSQMIRLLLLLRFDVARWGRRGNHPARTGRRGASWEERSCLLPLPYVAQSRPLGRVRGFLGWPVASPPVVAVTSPMMPSSQAIVPTSTSEYRGRDSLSLSLASEAAGVGTASVWPPVPPAKQALCSFGLLPLPRRSLGADTSHYYY